MTSRNLALQFMLLAGALLLTFNLRAAGVGPARCYAIDRPDPSAGGARAAAVVENWCYQRVPAGLYIYNADGGFVRPELALLVTDGIATHFSLLNGRRTVHRVAVKDFNPFGIPLEEPSALRPRAHAEADLTLARAEETLRSLELAPLSSSFSSLAVRAGNFSARASYLPWRGYWWPYKNQPLSGGPDSPLAKYDRYVEARTGDDPGARGWENQNHAYDGTWWHGHCNGWVASAILRSQPVTAKRDALSGVIFSVTDQKGLLAEADYCANVAFFGDRNDGEGDATGRDFKVKEFHRVITYYLGELRKPIAVDYRPDAAVDNNVISGYSMRIEDNGADTYNVTLKLTIHKYDTKLIQTPGIALSYVKTFQYVLEHDGGGNVTGGYWVSNAPDFLWVPLSTRSSGCRSNNQRISSSYINAIMNL